MNISGREYSKSTVGLRQPDKILDQNLKLVFIYPLLVDSKLNNYSELIRQFITTSMLKELEVSNFLNIVSMASSVSPLIDELGQIVDVGSTGSSRQTMRDMLTRNVQEMSKHEIERRVQEKTMRIQKILNLDPNLSQYNPILRMHTLNNFLDVPIIVGTRSFNIESIVFLFLFAIAISSQGKLDLNSPTDVERMFNILKNLDNNNINNILNALLSGPAKNWFERREDWISKHPRLDRFLKMRPLYLLGSYSSALGTWQPFQQAGRAIKKVGQTIGLGVSQPQSSLPSHTTPQTPQSEAVNPEFIDLVHDVHRNSIRMAQINFNNVLDPAAMARQFGYNPERGQLKHTFDRINPKLEQVFNLSIQYFSQVLWPSYVAPVLSSFFYTITPSRAGINITDLTQGMQTGSSSLKISPMVDPILEFIRNDFKTSINASLETKGPEQADIILSGMQNFCQTTFEKTTSILEQMNDVNTNAVVGTEHTIDQLMTYLRTFERAVSTVTAHTLTIDKLLRDILPNQLVNEIMTTRTERVINDSLNSVLDYLRTFIGYPMDTSYIIHTGIINTNAAMNDINNYIANSKKQIIFYIRYLFLHTIQYILCEYVKETKIAVETTKHDVMNQNNFTIVTSLELVMALANAFAAKNYRDLTEQDRRQEKVSANMTLIRNLNQNYVRGVATYIINQLNVPNLFIIDEKTQDVYYKLMYQSNVNTIKVNTMQTFVRNILN